MSIYINEPLVQKLPAFYAFMGGLNGFVKSSQALNKLTHAPRHWVGTRIAVKDNGYPRPREVSVAVYQDGILVHCNHANQTIEPVEFNAGQDNEYSRPLAVCLKCGDGWDEDGALVLEGNYDTI